MSGEEHALSVAIADSNLRAAFGFVDPTSPVWPRAVEQIAKALDMARTIGRMEGRLAARDAVMAALSRDRFQ